MGSGEGNLGRSQLLTSKSDLLPHSGFSPGQGRGFRVVQELKLASEPRARQLPGVRPEVLGAPHIPASATNPKKVPQCFCCPPPCCLSPQQPSDKAEGDRMDFSLALLQGGESLAIWGTAKQGSFRETLTTAALGNTEPWPKRGSLQARVSARGINQSQQGFLHSSLTLQ